MVRTKAATYAILAVAEIARRQSSEAGGVQAAEIARCLDLPAAYAAKVLTQLARGGILRSDRGPRGGFRLLKPTESIDLLTVIEAVDGPIATETALHQPAENDQQILRQIDTVFDRAAAQVRMALRGETIANLLSAAQDPSGDRVSAAS